MPRQIRISDDVADLVEQYQVAEGLKSLSAAANEMLAGAVVPMQPTRSLSAVVSNGCAHPLLARAGSVCGACGVTV